MTMIAAVIASAIDPIKLVLSLILFMSGRTKRWPVICVAVLLLGGYIAVVGMMLGRVNAGFVVTHLLSVLLLISIWAGLNRWLGLRFTTGLAGAATLACCTVIYFSTALPSLPQLEATTRQANEIAAAPTPQPLKPPTTHQKAAIQAGKKYEYTNIDAGIAASFQPLNTSIANQPGEGLGYRDITLQEIQGSN